MIKKKNLCYLLAGLLAVGMIWQILITKPVYAANLVLNGDTSGLRITPANEELFQVDGMLPGEFATSSIQINNTDRYAFSLLVEVKNLTASDPAEGEANLLDVLNIRVARDNTEIVGFPAKGGQYSLGRFAPGVSDTLWIDIGLSGQEADNTYQGKSAEFQWIFTAISEDPGEEGGAGGGGGGGGSGGSFAPVAFEDTALPDDMPQAIDLVDIPEDEVPLGAVDQPEADELVEVSDEDVPLGVVIKEMPQTGETPRLYHILAGLAIWGFGFIVLQRLTYDKK